MIRVDAEKKRLGRGTIRVLAIASGAVAFALPWAAMRLTPATTGAAGASTAPQVIVVPAGSSVVVAKGAQGVRIVKTKGTAPVTAATAGTSTHTTTGGSAAIVR